MARNTRPRRVYLDSSVWIALLTQEPTASALSEWLSGEPGQLITAHWTRTELASALSIKVRRGEIKPSVSKGLLQQFDEWVASEVQLLPVDSSDFLQASYMCADAASGLRAGDALHLAIALRCQTSHVASLDQNMLKNARRLGIENPLSNEH